MPWPFLVTFYLLGAPLGVLGSSRREEEDFGVQDASSLMQRFTVPSKVEDRIANAKPTSLMGRLFRDYSRRNQVPAESGNLDNEPPGDASEELPSVTGILEDASVLMQRFTIPRKAKEVALQEKAAVPTKAESSTEDASVLMQRFTVPRRAEAALPKTADGAAKAQSFAQAPVEDATAFIQRTTVTKLTKHAEPEQKEAEPKPGMVNPPFAPLRRPSSKYRLKPTIFWQPKFDPDWQPGNNPEGKKLYKKWRKSMKPSGIFKCEEIRDEDNCDDAKEKYKLDCKGWGGHHCLPPRGAKCSDVTKEEYCGSRVEPCKWVSNKGCVNPDWGESEALQAMLSEMTGNGTSNNREEPKPRSTPPPPPLGAKEPPI